LRWITRTLRPHKRPRGVDNLGGQREIRGGDSHLRFKTCSPWPEEPPGINQVFKFVADSQVGRCRESVQVWTVNGVDHHHIRHLSDWTARGASDGVKSHVTYRRFRWVSIQYEGSCTARNFESDEGWGILISMPTSIYRPIDFAEWNFRWHAWDYFIQRVFQY